MAFQVCIVGGGDMGRSHMKEWMQRSDAKIVSVTDANPKTAEAMARETGATAYESYVDAIRHKGVNVVAVCIPVCLHQEVACFAAEHGCHVITEKPIALTLPQAEKMIATAAKHRVKLAVSYQYREFPHFQKVRELVRAGEFGGPIFNRIVDIREVRSKLAMHRKSMNAGPVVDAAGHYFDLVRFFTGEEPLSVHARGHVFGKGKKRLDGITDFAIDAADVLVEYSGGHTLSYFCNWGMPEGFPGVYDELISGGPSSWLELSRAR